MLHKYAAFFIVTFLPLFSMAQKDTLNLLPFAQFVLDSGEWTMKTSHYQFESDLTTRVVFFRGNDPGIQLKIRFMDWRKSSLQELVDEHVEEFEEEDNIKTTISRAYVHDSICLLTVKLEPEVCEKDDELRLLLGDSATVILGIGVILEDFVLEIEPDEKMAFFLQAEAYRNAVSDLMKGMRLLSLEEADSIAGYPYTDEYVRTESSRLEMPVTDARKQSIVRDMKCLDEGFLRRQLSTYYGKQRIDSLKASGDEHQYEDLYVAMIHHGETHRALEKLNALGASGFTFSELIRLSRRYRDEIYPLTDYLNAMVERITRSDYSRLHVLKRMGMVENVSASSIDYHSGTFDRAIEQQVFNDSLSVVSTDLIVDTSRVLLLVNTANPKKKPGSYALLFTWKGLEWHRSLIPLPSGTGISAGDWMADESFDYTVLSQEDSRTFFVKGTDFPESEWQPIRIDRIDTTRFLHVTHNSHAWQNASNKSFHEFTIGSHVVMSGLKQRGLYALFLENFLEEYNTFETADLSEYSTYLEIEPGKFIDRGAFEVFVEHELSPADKAFSSNLLYRDLDGDGDEEIYHYALSNGKPLYIEVYSLEDGHLVMLSKTKARKLLEKNNLYRMDLIESLKGNYEGYHLSAEKH